MMKRRSFVIVLSDFLSEADARVGRSRTPQVRRAQRMVLHTLDPYELEFPFEGTWQFDGLEGEEPLITQPERIKEDYLANLERLPDCLPRRVRGQSNRLSLWWSRADLWHRFPERILPSSAESR